MCGEMCREMCTHGAGIWAPGWLSSSPVSPATGWLGSRAMSWLLKSSAVVGFAANSIGNVVTIDDESHLEKPRDAV
jgi:hypothetical protein